MTRILWKVRAVNLVLSLKIISLDEEVASLSTDTNIHTQNYLKIGVNCQSYFTTLSYDFFLKLNDLH